MNTSMHGKAKVFVGAFLSVTLAGPFASADQFPERLMNVERAGFPVEHAQNGAPALPIAPPPIEFERSLIETARQIQAVALTVGLALPYAYSWVRSGP